MVAENNGFKLLAIRPLKGCDEKFRKNLKEGEIYQFYQDFEFFVEIDGGTKSTKDLKLENYFDKNVISIKAPENEIDLYSEGNLKINISAVVGKNGSGKSALTDLYSIFLYALSTRYKYDSNKKRLNKITEDNELLIESLKNSYFGGKPKFTFIQSLKLISQFKLDASSRDFKEYVNQTSLLKKMVDNKLIFLYKKNQDDEKFENLIDEKLKVELIFSFEKEIFKLKFCEQKFTFESQSFENEKMLQKDYNLYSSFFYSVCLNYSHHSLNSSILGDWVNQLFHKNDGYQEPIVINPQRVKGVFDINNENELSKDKILYKLAQDIIDNKEPYIIGKYKVSEINFNIKGDFDLISRDSPIFRLEKFSGAKSNIKTYIEDDMFFQLTSIRLIKSIIVDFDFDIYTPFQDYAFGYLEYKIDKIKNHYLSKFIDRKGKFNYSIFLNFLKTDDSHITAKIRQTINYLNISRKDKTEWNENENYATASLSIEQYKSMLNEHNVDLKSLKTSQISDFLKPGFFSVDFKFENNETLRLSKLSSGEQQMIFNINTILYHLRNLDSIVGSLDFKRIIYQNVNVVLDEIELYYHPDSQRSFVKELTDEIKRFGKNGTNNIKSVNILLLTHSPFILSDITSNNILRLENGEVSKKEFSQTFGANIHELLANDFFLENGFMGEFAKKHIEGLIDKIANVDLKSQDEKLYKRLKSEIDLIGEPVLLNSLRSILDSKFEELLVLKERRKELENELERIKNQMNQ